MTLNVTILGCGSSGGVPRVGGGWGACDPDNPRNRRRRCSILVERRSANGTTRVLVDTSPDLREQLLDAGVSRLDAVLFTHDHADHLHGIDDLRPLVVHMRRRMPVYADAKTGAVLRERFGYCFETPPGSEYPPILNEHRIAPGVPVEIDGPGGVVSGLPFVLQHGSGEALGFRFADFVYANDVSAVPEASMAVFADADMLVLDALRHTPHPTHFSLPEALAFIERVRPRRAVLTNMHNDMDYADLAATLPAHIEPAYDGMRITVSAPRG